MYTICPNSFNVLRTLCITAQGEPGGMLSQKPFCTATTAECAETNAIYSCAVRA